MSDLVQHLASLPRTSASPARVTIGRTTFEGAWFSQERDHLPTSRAWQEGERTYTHEGFYLLGCLPASYVHRHADAYVDGEGRRFYIGGYFQGAPGSEFSHLHPFGRWFMLMPDAQDVTQGKPAMRCTVSR
jgi:hypothetical protein